MNLKTHLFDYQETAVEKLLPLRVGGLFMRMGTGKTRTAIEMVVRRVNRGQLTRVVWFCPVSVKATTRHELHKHTDIAPADLCVFNERTNLNNMPSALIYVIGIESMSSSPRVILAANELINETTMVIVDESTYIKGHTALCTRRITGMSEVAMYRLIMTGMPISQGVVDLYSQMRFLHWKILGYPSFYRFKSNHLEYSTKYPGMIVRGLGIEQREAELTRFRTDEDVQFLCVTPGTGSHGLDFTVSAYSIFYENEFKYLARKQAEDRHHRYPQTRPVTYVDIVCENSIDGRIQRAHQQKGNVVAQFKAKLDQAKRDNVPLADLIREL